jgi:hypothetical protein
VKKLGYEYPAGESRDTTLLRTLAVKQAADAGDERWVKRVPRWCLKVELFLIVQGDRGVEKPIPALQGDRK